MRIDQLRARRKKRHRERGAALVMVLLAIVVLTVFLTEVQTESSANFSAAIAERERLKAEYHARSGINLARLLIAMEPSVRATVGPMIALLMSQGGQGGPAAPPQIGIWEFSDQVLAPYNCDERAGDFASLAGVSMATGENLGLASEGCFDVVVVDEESKINVNVAAQMNPVSRQRLAEQLMGMMASPQYDALFQELDLDGQRSDRQAICSALIDWADSDENLEPCDLSSQAQNTGSEDNYYQTIRLDYFRKNAAFDSLEELRLVRGMGDDFWATFVDPDPRNPKKRNLTVWGSDKVNFNTANAQTLYYLVCAYADPTTTTVCPGSAAFDPLQAMQFIQFVGMVKAFTAGIPLFGTGSQFLQTLEGKGMLGPLLAGMGIPPMTFTSRSTLEGLLTAESKIFSIYAEGVVPGRGRETRVSIHAVVDFRNAMDLQSVNPLANAMNQGAQPGAPANQGAPRDEASQGSGAQPDPTATLAADLAKNPAGNVIYWRIQ